MNAQLFTTHLFAANSVFITKPLYTRSGMGAGNDPSFIVIMALADLILLILPDRIKALHNSFHEKAG
jgi:hypothetical protein